MKADALLAVYTSLYSQYSLVYRSYFTVIVIEPAKHLD